MRSITDSGPEGGSGKFKLGATWLAPLVGADALGSQPGGLSDPAGTRRWAFGSDDPFQDGPLGRSWEAIPVGTGIRLGVERGAQVLGLDQLLDGVQRRPVPIRLGVG
jgi:hypothetical protein